MRNGLVVMALAGMAACGGGNAANSGVVRADSAGVAIVTSPGVDRELAWTFEDVGVFTDSAGEPWLFERVGRRAVLVDGGGRIYVMAREDAPVIRFNPDGTFDRTIGRKGGGPGEVQYPGGLAWQGDTLVIADPMLQTLVRFGPDLKPVSNIPLRDSLSNISALHVRANGWWVERRRFTGEFGKDLVQWNELYADTAVSARPMLASPPTATFPVTLPCPGGSRVAVSIPPFFTPELSWSGNGNRLLGTVGPQYALQLHDGSRLVSSIRRAVDPVPPTREDLERRLPNGMEVRIGSSTAAACQKPVGELMDSPGMAPLKPFVFDVALLADGTIWAQRSQRQDTVPVIDVFDAEGAYAGTMRGRSLPLAQLSNGEVLFLREDQDTGGFHIVRTKVTQ